MYVIYFIQKEIQSFSDLLVEDNDLVGWLEINKEYYQKIGDKVV